MLEITDTLQTVKGFLKCMVTVAAALWPATALHAEPTESRPPGPAKVVIIPIRAEISNPELYILRRGLKVAMEQKADTVILDMETPGGPVDITFEMVKALEKFPGKTVTYVNREAMSAGALISAGTDEIHFSPGGVIGSAAPVDSSGADIESTMRKKVVSYLKARVRSVSAGKGYRPEVISAMIDEDFEFKIGDEVIKPKGTLLALTAQEAMKTYGDPPQPLLGAGISDNLDDLVVKLHGRGNHTVTRLEATWSEGLAQYIVRFSPVLMGIGLLGLFIEFKTPGFGFFGIAGIVIMAVVFFGQNAAGLSGHEPALIFMLGVLLLVVEVFFFPGTVLPALAGIALMLGSLVWAMVDHWPGESVAFSGEVMLRPLLNVVAGVVLAVLFFIAILKFLPKGGPWGRMILETSVGGNPAAVPPVRSSGAPGDDDGAVVLVGMTGVAATGLFPSGQVIIGGRRYEARLEVGHADAGSRVIVTAQTRMSLIVEVLS